MELTDQEMLELYGISEWHEKSLVLRPKERDAILKNLSIRKSSSLVAVAKLPFPHFAYSYFSCFESSKPYLDDPAFGYKLYLLPDGELLDVSNYLINESMIHECTARFLEYRMMPLDKIPFLTIANDNRKIIKKYVYIAQYIDQLEATRLGLSMVKSFESLHEDGYEINKKLELFNPVIRKIFENYFGLNGKEAHTNAELTELLYLPKKTLYTLVRDYEQYFLKSTSILRNKLEPIGEKDGLKLYANRSFRKDDLRFETTDYFRQRATEAEKAVLKLPGNNLESFIYIAKKHLFPSMTTRELADYLEKNINQIEEAHPMDTLSNTFDNIKKI